MKSTLTNICQCLGMQKTAHRFFYMTKAANWVLQFMKNERKIFLFLQSIGINSNRGLHFCLILQVPFPQPRIIFLVANQTSSILFSNYYAFFTMFIICNVYFQKITFKCLLVNIYLLLLTVFRDKKTAYTFQLKYFKHNVTLLQAFPRKVISDKDMVPITVGGWKSFEKNKPGRGDGYSGTKNI